MARWILAIIGGESAAELNDPAAVVPRQRLNLPWYCGQASFVAPERAAQKTTSSTGLASSGLACQWTTRKWWTILLSRFRPGVATSKIEM